MDKEGLDLIIEKIEDGKIPVIDAGLLSYDRAFYFQSALAREILEKDLKGAVLLLEHPPVITIGSNRNTGNLLANRQQLKEAGIKLFSSNRGGDITLHAPGQIVCYPIFNLNHFGRDVNLFVYNLEQVVLDTILSFGISGTRLRRHRGVFTGKCKIASIGLHVKKWISIHGFSLNVNIDLSYFEHITACGLKDFPQASMVSLLKKDMAIDDVKEQIINNFETVFGITAEKTVVPYSF